MNFFIKTTATNKAQKSTLKFSKLQVIYFYLMPHIRHGNDYMLFNKIFFKRV